MAKLVPHLTIGGNSKIRLYLESSSSTVEVKEEGTSLGAASALDVVGPNITAVRDGSTIRITHTDSPSGIAGIVLKDEGVEAGTVDTIDIVGDHLSVSVADGVATITHTHPSNAEALVHNELHLVSADEVTNGCFYLGFIPSSATSVSVTPVGGPQQVNKQSIGDSGATPDFDVLKDIGYAKVPAKIINRDKYRDIAILQVRFHGIRMQRCKAKVGDIVDVYSRDFPYKATVIRVDPIVINYKGHKGDSGSPVIKDKCLIGLIHSLVPEGTRLVL